MTIELTLFFTEGMSLKAWEGAGMLERELALYRRLQAAGVQVTLVTYGRLAERAYTERLDGIRLVHNRWKLPNAIYRWWLMTQYRGGRQGWIAKSNQVQGAEVALAAARRGGRFVARCGYLYSLNTSNEYGPDSAEADKARRLEKLIFQEAQKVMVTTEAIRLKIIEVYELAQSRVQVIPNYVDTDLFHPAGQKTQTQQVCFVGRLEPEKNIFSLLDAMTGLDAKLTLAGEGSLRGALEVRAAELGVQAQFLGALPNAALPALLNDSAVYVLPSLYEGHPKTLIEAMACGAAVVGTNVPGIRELITDGENGRLCAPDAASLRAALAELLGNAELRARLGAAAREYAVAQFSLDEVVKLELALYEDIAEGR
ncbi:MAG: glycosyltransferase family 1 protein [Anaerolineae bacterium]|nr:MAG: glycosyltransferase family 1 protein [Anaerolineae bacterium]